MSAPVYAIIYEHPRPPKTKLKHKKMGIIYEHLKKSVTPKFNFVLGVRGAGVHILWHTPVQVEEGKTITSAGIFAAMSYKKCVFRVKNDRTSAVFPAPFFTSVFIPNFANYIVCNYYR